MIAVPQAEQVLSRHWLLKVSMKSDITLLLSRVTDMQSPAGDTQVQRGEVTHRAGPVSR